MRNRYTVGEGLGFQLRQWLEEQKPEGDAFRASL